MNTLELQQDFWDELPEALKAEIEEGLADIEKGDVFTHEEIVEKMQLKYGFEL